MVNPFIRGLYGQVLLIIVAMGLTESIPHLNKNADDDEEILENAPFDIGTADRNLLQIPRRFKLLFMDENDIENVKGWVKFVSNPLHRMDQRIKGRDMENLLNVPQADGSWISYGMAFEGGEIPRHPRPGHKYYQARARTKDGFNYFEQERKAWDGDGPGTGMLTQKSMAYNAASSQYLLMYFEWWGHLSHGRGWPLHGYLSDDGLTFKATSKQPAYTSNDGIHVMWDPRTRDYFSYPVLFQPWPKAILDNAEHGRRVIGVIRSSNGIDWQPRGGLVEHQWKNHSLLTPNEYDPENLEFYWFTPFPYADRYIGMMLLYEPSPPEVNSRAPGVPNAHGPMLATEWWVSRDGLNWNRPYQHQYLGLEPYPETGFANGRPGAIQADPVIAQNKIIFHTGYGLPEDRFGAVAAAGNAEFSTHLFVMPRAPVFLNASARYLGPDSNEQNEQGYIMVEARDERGESIPGYHREACYFKNVDDLFLPLKWGDRCLTELAGQKIRLHFYLRNARIYAVTTKAGVVAPGESTPVIIPKHSQVIKGPRFLSGEKPFVLNDLNLLLKELNSPDPDRRRRATWPLAKIGDSRAIEPLIKATHDHHSLVRYFAAQALWDLEGNKVLPRLMKEYRGESSWFASLAEAMKDLWREEVVLAVRDLAISSSDSEDRLCALETLGTLGYTMVIPDVLQFIDDPEEEIRKTATNAMSNLARANAPDENQSWIAWWNEELSDEKASYAVYSALIDHLYSPGEYRTVIINQYTVKNPMAPEDWRTLLNSIGERMPSVAAEAIENLVKKGWRDARLEPTGFATKAKVVILDPKTLIEILNHNGSSAIFQKRYPNSSGLMRLSRVGFNNDRSRAFLFAGNMRDNFYGGAVFYSLEYKNGHWVVLDELPVTALSNDPNYQMPSLYSHAF